MTEPEIVYTVEHTDLWCEHHRHLASEWSCSYTSRPNEAAENRRPIRVHVNTVATIPIPDLSDIT